MNSFYEKTSVGAVQAKRDQTSTVRGAVAFVEHMMASLISSTQVSRMELTQRSGSAKRFFIYWNHHESFSVAILLYDLFCAFNALISASIVAGS